MEQFLTGLKAFIPVAIVTVFFVLLFVVVSSILRRQSRGKSDTKIIRQIVKFLIVLVGMIAFMLTLPMDAALKERITQLMGIIISAVIALSSATLIGNMLAGILLRIINNFKPGDFIEIDNYFGRVIERGLFHTEIQSEDSDLVTLPNMFLATNPVKVKRFSGSYIDAEVSLGYDVSRQDIENCLIRAAENTGLENSYVSINNLGDYSVVYQVHGKLNDIKKIISMRSLLRARMLDELHQAGIEIVSPTFMNQRQVNEVTFIPKQTKSRKEHVVSTVSPESKIFDKAEKAESIEKRKEKMEDLEEQVKALQAELKDAESPEEKDRIREKIEKCKALREKILSNIEAEQEKLKEDQ